METIIVNESGVIVFGDDLDGPDAQDAREDALHENTEKLLAKAKRLRITAEKLLAKAKAAEEAAAACLPRTDMECEDIEWNPDPDPLVLLSVGERVYAFDPVELALCGVRDLDDTEILEQYIGSSADVTERLARNAGGAANL